MKREKAPLLVNAIPSLAAEVSQLLEAQGELELAAQVSALRLKSRCTCGDDFCATIHTGAGKPYDSIDLDPEDGMINLDIDEAGQIAGIEVLFRDEYKLLLDELLPISSRASK